MRFIDRLDKQADTLADAADRFRERRAALLAQLQAEKEAFDDALMATEDWAVVEGLIPHATWTDDSGDTFIPWVRTEVKCEPVPDYATILRERAAQLRS